jgi:hypothetical protein
VASSLAPFPITESPSLFNRPRADGLEEQTNCCRLNRHLPSSLPISHHSNGFHFLSSELQQGIEGGQRQLPPTMARVAIGFSWALQFRPVSIAYAGKRNSSTSSPKDLKETLKEVIPGKREQLKKLKTEHGNKTLGEIKVEQAIGGMRYLTHQSIRKLANR